MLRQLHKTTICIFIHPCQKHPTRQLPNPALEDRSRCRRSLHSVIPILEIANQLGVRLGGMRLYHRHHPWQPFPRLLRHHIHLKLTHILRCHRPALTQNLPNPLNPVRRSPKRAHIVRVLLPMQPVIRRRHKPLRRIHHKRKLIRPNPAAPVLCRVPSRPNPHRVPTSHRNPTRRHQCNRILRIRHSKRHHRTSKMP